MTRWSQDTTWQGLEIVATERGGEADAEGIVEFIARGSTNGTPFAQRERSRFRRVDGAWYYLHGKVGAAPAARAVSPGRCRSGLAASSCPSWRGSTISFEPRELDAIQPWGDARSKSR